MSGAPTERPHCGQRLVVSFFMPTNLRLSAPPVKKFFRKPIRKDYGATATRLTENLDTFVMSAVSIAFFRLAAASSAAVESGS